MDEGHKRVLAIVAGIIVARHFNTAARTDNVAAAIQWAERIMPGFLVAHRINRWKIDNVFSG